ncbi:MAG: GEVED domain-containing protein [Janthinobacterium lividum]
MKQPFTAYLKLLLLALALGTGYTSWGQTYSPITLTAGSYTDDVVANGLSQTAASASTTASVDNGNYRFLETTFSSTATASTRTQGLPPGGSLTSAATTGLTFQLASYSANNALRLATIGTSGTLAFATPQAASEVYVLANAGNGPMTATMVVNFADGTTQSFGAQTIPDWFLGTQTLAANTLTAFQMKARVLGTGTTAETATADPRLYQIKLTLDAANITKLITGVTVTQATGTGVIVAMGVSVGVYPVCAAAPTGLQSVATTTSGGATALTTACPSTSIYLSLTGLAANTAGYTYQWQSSPDGTTWTNITGATSATYTATGQTAATYYRALVACLFDGAGGTATPAASVQVAQSPFNNCYCTPAATSGCGTYASLLKVELTGTTLSSTTTCPASPYYTNYPVATATATLTPGASYPMSVTIGRYAKVAVWIDYDQSGTFDASEYTSLGSNATNTAGSTLTLTPTLTIPITALSGQTRMRVRTQYFTTAFDGTSACITNVYGETEDYTVTISPTAACSGTPPALTASASATAVCSGTGLTLSATGATAGITGFTYQWQSSPAGANTFTNLGTAQVSSSYTVASQSVATDYRVLITCTASTLSATSNVVAVAMNPFLTCYCVPTYTLGGTGDYVARVVLGTLDNATTGNASPYYRDYSAAQTGASPTLAVPTIFPGTNAAVTVTFGTDSNQHGAVWIDFNQNGILGDVANEFVATTASAGTNGVVTLTLPVPAGAVLGTTKMRIRGGDDTNDPTLGQACGASGSSYGEGEDYLVNVAAPVPCTGTPPATTATSSASSGCPTASFTLGVTGIAASSTGLSYQWQSSPAGANTFTNLGSAQTSPSYTVASQTATTDYRVVVTCTASGLTSTSSLVTVTRTYLNCYCTVVSGVSATSEYIKSVTFPGTPGFTNTTGATPSTNGTGDFTTNTALTTTLTQGSTYTGGVSVTVRSNNTNSQGGFWIDYDHSGTFDANEYTLIGTSSLIATDVTFPVTLVVPSTALLGQTRVRVRWRNGAFATTDACVSGATTWYGETEDYFVTIAAPTTCSTPPATVVAAADVTNACANSSFTLSTSSVPTTLGGFTYQWQSRTGTNAFANIAGATTNPYTIVSQAVATDYQLVVSCQFGGTPVTSNIVSVGQNSFNQCYCTASSTNVCSNYGVITSVVLGTINNPSGCTSANSYSDYTTQSTNLAAGATATLTLGVASATTTFNYNYGVWIDFNHNGTFDTSEFIVGSTTAVSTTSVTISLPIPALSGSVLAGATRIRIRTNAGIAAYGFFTATGANNACGAVYNGETEDYTVNLVDCSTTTAAFSYPAGPYCASGTTSPTPTITGTTGGTFSSTTGLTINATTGVITLASSTPGTYTVTYAIAGTCAVSSTQMVTINAAPVAGFSYPNATACAGTATTLTPTLATGATAGTYSLPTTTGLSINATTGVVTVAATATAGTYTVTNTVAASGGCAAVTSTATFVLTAPTTATFSYTGSPFCASGTTAPTPAITGTAGGTFSSTTGLTINATTGAITLASSTPGTYTVTYTVAGACGSSSTQSVTITAAPTAGFSYPTTTACAGTAATRTPALATGATAGTYSLPTATGLSINATTGVVTIGTTAVAGTYTVTNTVAASGGCAAVTSTATLTITAAPATPTLTTSGTPATGILLTSSAATGNQFYLNGVLIPGATAQTYLINSGTKNGSYTVTVTNAAGCSATSAAVNVTVTATAPVAAATSLTVFPNPTHDGLLTLELSGYRETVQVTVVNALGQRVYETTLSGSALTQRQTLNLSELATGVYLLQARTATGGLELRRIVRE